MISEKTFITYESEVRSYCRSFPAVFTDAKGSLMYDQNGKEYIDFFCGAGALNYGHNNPYIKGKVMDYLNTDGIIHAMDMMTTVKGELLEFIQNHLLKPRKMDYKIMFPAPTGTNAVEAALKLARKVKDRKNIWALMGCFHGMTLGSLALTTDRDARAGAGSMLGDVTHIPAPYMLDGFDSIKYMEMLLNDDHSGAEKPAALIIETVQAEGGIWIFSEKWLKDVEKFCSRNDILLIIDDIQVGCARTGTFFSFERANLHPDIFVLSKSIGGGIGMPFALTFFKPELDVWKPGEHNGTFRGNQLAMVASKAGIEYMIENKIETGVVDKERKIQKYLKQRIDRNYDIRGIGCIWGIDVKSGELSKKIAERCFEKGLICERAGRKNSVVKIMPALNIDDSLLLTGLEIICDSINEVKLR